MDNPIEDIIKRDPRFRPEAYVLVHEALGYTQEVLHRERHVTGQELCEGIRQFCIERYGLMAKSVLSSWGIRTTDDFGAIVYNLIDAGLMAKTKSDRIEDFHAVYDFDQAFIRSYQVPETDKIDG